MKIRGPLAFVLAAVLVASLAANFLVLGFAAARFGGIGQVDLLERIVALGARNFPGELRRDIGEALARNRTGLRSALDDVQEARRRMFEAMAADPFDRVALDTAFAEVREKTDTLQRLGQDLVGDAVERASPEARAEIHPPRHLR